jgi:hypothetical protein
MRNCDEIAGNVGLHADGPLSPIPSPTRGEGNAYLHRRRYAPTLGVDGLAGAR